MAGMKRGTRIASLLLLIMVLASACNQQYSQAPSVTNTPIDPNSLFATALVEPTTMSDVERFATETAMAAITPTPTLDATALATETGATPSGDATHTPTPLISINPTNTPTATLAVAGTTTTPGASGVRPTTYALQKGEFPYCIARRFNVNPDELLALNNLSSGTIYYPGLTLKIPQTGNPFPGNRALRNHPTTYTVASSDETISGIACLFGDVDPAAIAQANGLSVNAPLTVGQQLNIP